LPGQHLKSWLLPADTRAIASVPPAVPAEVDRDPQSQPPEDPRAFAAYLVPRRRAEWVVYAKRPFGGPQPVLAYLSRYTHRFAIANSRLIACDRSSVTLRWKDYRAEGRDHDTRHRRVHPSLPDPRPAARLPPHPFRRGGLIQTWRD
jgi:hypothetical protein